LVEITALTEAEMKAYLETVTSSSETEKEKLQKIYEAAKAEYNAANIELANAKSVLLVASHRREEELERMNMSINDLSFKQANVNSLTVSFESKKSAMKTAKTYLDRFPSAEFYFQNLPPGEAKAFSDANGNFILKLPKKGKYALAASNTKMIRDNQENYYWLIWINVEGKQTSPFVLSNHNVMTIDSPDNIRKVASLGF
jgi:hypothetical protein